MNDPFLFLIIIPSGVFLLLTLIRQLVPWKFCTICGSIFFTWLAVLLNDKVGQRALIQDQDFMMLLIGESVAGFYYFVLRKIPERYHILRFPILMTLTVGGYSLGRFQMFDLRALGVLMLLWIVFTSLLLLSRHPNFRKRLAHMFACCRDW